MEIIQKNEAFQNINGKMQFSYIQICARQDGILYSGKWTHRFTLPQSLDDLRDLKEIPTEDRGPEVKASWSAVYIKTPNLLSYANKNLERQITREIETCELLRQNPHPNIATYYGYIETRGRVSRLCFKRYTTTLLEAVNPEYLNKSGFLSSKRDRVEESMKRGLDGILSGIKHLHSLGLVRNDVTPANIMLGGDVLVLVDFDSCRFIGESLRDTDTKRTYHWHDPAVEFSRERNDLDAFEDLRTWLTGSKDEEFIFG
ncbi:hypothetical protein N7492_010262 [Penicillium capsulatum]|uniref:Protein kinase domain-containing protein n=1 Tax=Penicillium capsulatum TaxID=69766 RepID=A0A9W9HM38_9EURO|nr:hypothetical protein N7492_010262 [Penicillium capsulatum]KAJ6112769.1 hypothetical protein N7512_008093 [Penicillium capsulatum]